MIVVSRRERIDIRGARTKRRLTRARKPKSRRPRPTKIP
jgi:hypothetical protein